MTDYFAWLGSKRAYKKGIGNKGALLDFARRQSLPTPNGGILLHEFYEDALADGLLQLTGQQISIPDPSAFCRVLYEDVRWPRMQQPVAVRSAFSEEDTPDQSLAGYFASVLDVDPTNDIAFAQALATVWTSALKQEGAFRRDVLVLDMVKAQKSGVAFTQANYEDDLVNVTDGLADKLVSGEVSGDMMTLPCLVSFEPADETLPPFAQRLQKLLRGVRTVFDGGDWDVEWADDGRDCWLVQIRPITRAPRRNEAFTFANIREIMPDPPSPFMTSIVGDCANGLFAYYRQFDATLPDDRPLVEVLHGRPVFNLSLLTDMMRRWGLPTALVTNSIGGTAEYEVTFRLGRFLRKTAVLLKQGWAQLTAVRSAQKATQIAQQLGACDGRTFEQTIIAFRQLFTLLVTQMFNLTAALSGPLLILRRTNTLHAHNAHHQAISTQMYTDLAPLRARAQANEAVYAALQAGTLPTDEPFLALWHAYLQKHGHRGVYESDIARPRYHEAPASLLQSLAHPAPAVMEPAPLNFRAQLTRPIWWQCQRVLNAREHWRYEVMVAYDQLRQLFLQLAEKAVQNGQLTAVEHLWLLTSEELIALDSGAIYDMACIQQKQAEFEALQQLDLPDLIRRFDPVHTDDGFMEGNLSQFGGIPLTMGIVSGQAWVLHEPATTLPDGFVPENTILVARSVDAGWIPTFALVSGVAVEIGGDLSHGSIILREIGLPAVTNMQSVSKHLKTGDRLTLNASTGQLQKQDFAN